MGGVDLEGDGGARLPMVLPGRGAMGGGRGGAGDVNKCSHPYRHRKFVSWANPEGELSPLLLPQREMHCSKHRDHMHVRFCPH